MGRPSICDPLLISMRTKIWMVLSGRFRFLKTRPISLRGSKALAWRRKLVPDLTRPIDAKRLTIMLPSSRSSGCRLLTFTNTYKGIGIPSSLQHYCHIVTCIGRAPTIYTPCDSFRSSVFYQRNPVFSSSSSSSLSTLPYRGIASSTMP